MVGAEIFGIGAMGLMDSKPAAKMLVKQEREEGRKEGSGGITSGREVERASSLVGVALAF